MNEYTEAGMIVIQLTAMASLWAVIAVAYACTKGFITDTIPTMPWHLSGILTMREYGYGGNNLHGIVDPISWFSLFQTVLIAIGVSLLSILVWPLYILLAVMYTLRATYRGRKSIMKLFRAMISYTPKRPSALRDLTFREWKGIDVEKTHRAPVLICTCGGAPHDDDCAVLKDIDMVPPGSHVPRWAREPEAKQDGGS